MGCGNSSQTAVSADTTTSSQGKPKTFDENKELTSDYVLGEVLGQGAFGVVHACAKKDTQDFCYAVKMVDKVETPLAEIKKEAEMMKDLAHGNVVKLHDVYFEKCFVCMVMDAYKGGDLIDCMQLHWKTKGKIQPLKVVHILKGMSTGIAHVHSKMYVHRDIKGDNFLTDRRDITDPGCKIFLSDFGTAVRLTSPTQRLRSSCGTKLYWPPEFFDGNYSFKVDVWAVGVIAFGLCDGRFPFKNEQDSRKKQVRLPDAIPQLCRQLVYDALDKNEANRMDAATMMKHPWITNNLSGGAASTTTDEQDKNWVAEGMDDGDGVNGAQDARRQELIERLEKRGQRAGNTSNYIKAELLWSPGFEIGQKRSGLVTRYEWREAASLQSQKIIDLSKAKSQDDNGNVDAKTVEKMLIAHNIDTKKFGQGEFKTMNQFATEVHNGSAILMLDAAQHKKIVRVVDVVLLRINAGGKYLIEDSETFADGRTRGNLNRLPGTKKEPHENTAKTSKRIVADLLGMQAWQLNFDFANREVFEEEETSRSFPGVTTVYRKEIVEAKVVLSPGSGGTTGEQFSHRQANNTEKTYVWMTDEECRNAKIKLRAPSQGEEVSALVQAPIGISVDELTKLLQDNKVDVDAFGQNNAKSLRQFSDELIKGDASLIFNDEGKLQRLVDIVILMINHEGREDVLVEASEKRRDSAWVRLERLPGTKRRPDENQFVAAQRLLKRQLKIDENTISINGQDVLYLEEERDTPHYPGITTVYRRRIIKAELLKEN
eukprot:TRINITY_DN4674_c0_g1_i1.p1 TRINITY_DN4674_c0_g1~~TRINITY_DN4674_c0_g1_i1.p1  ORF type:complete len:769 (+),score=209.32 TRINITY_DN4674_c0_g1_i1:194-2500(+)